MACFLAQFSLRQADLVQSFGGFVAWSSKLHLAFVVGKNHTKNLHRSRKPLLPEFRKPFSYLCRDSQSSTETDISEHRHLALVFFDILLLDEKCLLETPYSQRRALLESTILLSPGESMIAGRVPISMEPNNTSERALDEVFSAIIADYQEGLVIKAEESRYHDYKMPWVKLKKDYIPGYGDAVDLVVVGAIWDKTRGRELRGVCHNLFPLIRNKANSSSAFNPYNPVYWGPF